MSTLKEKLKDVYAALSTTSSRETIINWALSPKRKNGDVLTQEPNTTLIYREIQGDKGIVLEVTSHDGIARFGLNVENINNNYVRFLSDIKRHFEKPY